MDKKNLEEKNIQDNEVRVLGDEDLEKVAGGLDKDYYYEGAPDD